MVSFGINNSNGASPSKMYQNKFSDNRLASFTGQGGKSAGSIFGSKTGGMQATPPNSHGPGGPQKGKAPGGAAPGGIFAQAGKPKGATGGTQRPGGQSGSGSPGGMSGANRPRTFLG